MVVNVWDADREGAGVPAKIICQLSSHQLDEGPCDPDQIYVPYGQYYIYSVEYDLWDDPVLAPGGTDSIPGTVEQVTMKPTSEVRVIAGLMGTIEDHYPDLRGGHDTGYLAIRVSVRGRDKHGLPASPLHPRRTPLEDHLIEAWPVAGPASRVVPKRDEFSRRWENSHGGRRS